MRLEDSIVVSIPANLTVDLGFCVERTKQKRLQKLSSWEKKYISKYQHDGGDAMAATEIMNGVRPDIEDTEGNSDSDAQMNAIPDGENANILRREQFGGIIDYLEAKYVRGVMVEDPDEKLRRKRRKTNLTKTAEWNSAKRLHSIDDDISGTEINGDRSFMEKGHEDDQMWKGLQNDEDLSYSTGDDARSIYSEDSFLDDSLLVKSVAEQVHASSLTKIEADAKKRKPEVEKSTRMKLHPNESTKICSGSTEGILVELDDFSFFVNVGDLEMEKGHEEYPAIDWHLPTKHKSKRSVVELLHLGTLYCVH